MSVYLSQQHRASRPPPEMLGINVERPKFPQFAMMNKRLESFDTWPEYLPVAVKDLVEAGLVYTGVGDSVRCYHCGGGLRSWEPNDDPMMEHAKWYPNCPHLMLVKGKAYIERVRSGEPLETDHFDSGIESLKVSQISAPCDYLDTPAAQSCIDMGYSQEMVKKAITVFKQKRGTFDFKGTDLCEILFAMEDSPEEFQDSELTDETTEDISHLGLPPEIWSTGEGRQPSLKHSMLKHHGNVGKTSMSDSLLSLL
ncbi:Protein DETOXIFICATION 47 [Mactra antiquata]